MAEKIHPNSLKPDHKILWYEIKEILGHSSFGINYPVNVDFEKRVNIRFFMEYFTWRLSAQKLRGLSHNTISNDGK